MGLYFFKQILFQEEAYVLLTMFYFPYLSINMRNKNEKKNVSHIETWGESNPVGNIQLLRAFSDKRRNMNVFIHLQPNGEFFILKNVKHF